MGVLVIPLTGYAQRIRFSKLTEQEISHRSVLCILQDRDGFMWFGSRSGLNRYDGYIVEVFGANVEGLIEAEVTALEQDRFGNIWIGVNGAGLYRFDPETEDIQVFRHIKNDPKALSSDQISALWSDDDGVVWIGTSGGGLNRYDPASQHFEAFTYQQGDSNSLSHNDIKVITPSRDGSLWLGSNGGGLNRFYPNEKRFERYQWDLNNPQSLSDDLVRAVYEDKDGYVWVGTFSDGLNRLDPNTGLFTRFGVNPDDPMSLRDGLVRSIIEDQWGELWIGANGGVSRLDRDTGQFQHFFHIPDDPYSLSHDSVWSLFEDRSGMIWVGTDGGAISKFDPGSVKFIFHGGLVGDALIKDVTAIEDAGNGALWLGSNGHGLIFLDSEGQTQRYRYNPNRSGGIRDDVVWALEKESNDFLWVGSKSGLSRLEIESGVFEHIDHSEHGSPEINTLYNDPDYGLWISTEGEGLWLYQDESDRMTRFQHLAYDHTSLSNNVVVSIMKDRNGAYWVCTWGGGLNRFDPAREVFSAYNHQPGDHTSISSDRIYGISEGSDGYLWLATSDGLNRFDPELGFFARWSVQEGLPHESIYSVLSDGKGRIWFSTPKGLGKYDPGRDMFSIYDSNDSLPMENFNPRVFGQGDSLFYFGGSEGLLGFRPEDVKNRNNKPPIVLRDFRKLEESVPLGKPVHKLDSLVLDHDDVVFSVEFAALTYANPERNRYAYKLEGFNDEWVPTGTRREVTFSKLKPGDYILRIKGSNNDGVWNEEGKTVQIKVKEPPWQTWQAYLVYVVAIILIIMAYIRVQQKKLRKERMMVQKEHMVASRLRELNKMKDEFLANTSHELRTPLHGIIGLAESLVDGAGGSLSQKARHDLKMIIASGKRLGNLVNDILDFSMLKNRSLELQKKAVDVYALTDVVCTLTRPLIGSKNLKLINDIKPEDRDTVLADESRIQQVLYNLIGNAVKYTEEGEIRVKTERKDEVLTISISDTGTGIPKSMQRSILSTFGKEDTADSRRTTGGTGLGLTITQQLIELHGGEIHFVSTQGAGSVFSFTLPLIEAETFSGPESDATLTPRISLDSEDEAKVFDIPVVGSGEKTFRILVVDDEPVNLQVLSNHISLQPQFESIEAASGQGAIDLLSKESFDLVLLDIMMPMISGYEVCRVIRERFTVNELPVIFLSARNQVADLVMGFDAGGNDYLIKPVTKNELLARVNTHIRLLDINRNLEHKVFERTKELEERNEKILRAQSKLILKDKMASLGTLTAGVAHEIRNPLNFINNLASLSSDLITELREVMTEASFDDDLVTELLVDLSQNADIILQHGSRANRIVHRMMELARGEEVNPQPTPLNDLVDEFVSLAYQSNQVQDEHCEILIVRDYDSRVGLVEIMPQNVSRAIVNLMNNAIEAVAVKDYDQYQPKIEVCTQLGDGCVTVNVKDNGVGILPEHRDQVFIPFFTTKPSDSDHIGLGLSFALDVALHHGGELLLDSEPGSGALFSMVLPLKAESI